MSGRKRPAGESLVQADPETARVDDPFPRGGGFSVAPIEIKRAAADATRDVFETVKAAKKSKKSSSKSGKNSNKPAPVISARIEPLALGKIKVGTLILGQISSLKQEPNEYVVSLPNNLTGYCLCENLNPQLVGSFLRFVVEGLGINAEDSTANGTKQKKRLALNASPDLVNACLHPETVVAGSSVQGEVVSVEEKGVILNLGTELGRGFLALSKPELAKYTAGDFLMAFLTSNDGTQRIKTLSADPAAHVDSAIAQPAFVPGTLISSAPVVNDSVFGAQYSLLGIYTASADSVHSSGKSKAVRVIFSHPPTSVNGDRMLGVSNLDSLVNLTESPFFEAEERPRVLKTGSVVNVEILKTCPSLGVFAVILGTGLPSGAPGFVHISQIGEKDNDKIDLNGETEYKVGTVHPARVLSYSAFDNTFYLSLRPDVIAQQYLSIDDIKIGDIVENARVERIMSRGDVLVRLDGPTVGICSEQQLSDAPVRNPEQRFKIGQKVKARVLNVDISNRKVYVTLKKSIIEDKEPLLTSFTNDSHFHAGTVVKFVDSGAVILFYNNIKGLLLKSEMSETGTDMQSLLRLGETVRCRILETDPVNERLLLSLKPRSELQNVVGEIKKGVVISKTKKETLVQVLEPGNSDPESADLGEAVLIGSKGKLSVGDSFDVKVLSSRTVCNDEKIVSTELPSSVDSIQVGSLIYGLVSGSHPQAGVFVKFLNDFTGLVSANLLGETKWPAINSVVEVVVDSVDFAKSRVFLSLPKSQPLIDVTITAVKQNQLNVVTSDGRQGRIDSSLLFNSIDEIDDPKKPLSQFKTGETVSKVRVIGKHDAKNHRFLPLSHKSGTSVVLEVAKHDPVVLKKGGKVLAFVNNYSPDYTSLWLTISPQTRVQLSLVDLSNQLPVLEDPITYFPIGSAVELTILNCGSKIAATALDLEKNESESQLYCLVTAVDLLKLTVRLPKHRTEVIECVDSGDVFTKLKDTFKVGDILPYNVINDHVTLRSEKPKGISAFTVGSVINGYVRNIASSGIFVSLAPKVVARVQIKEISDKYLKNWQTFVKPGDVITAKVLTNNGRIELTMKQSSITGKKTQQIDDIVVGAKYRGVVRSVAAFGVFVDFEHVTGLAHKSEISDHVIDDLKLVFKPGDKVRVKVLEKTEEDGRVSLGMKAAYFEDDDGQDDLSEGDDLDVDHEAKLAESSADSDAEIISDEEFNGDDFIIDNDSDENNSDSDNDSDENSDNENDESDDDSDMDVDEVKDKKSAGISAGFDWSGEVPTLKTNDDDESSSDSDVESSRKKKKRSKKDEIVRDETASLQNRLPQSAKDFERLLVSSPNSSMVWMNYMAFKLQLGETEDARLVAYRALKTIAQSQEAERLNIWIALLNLEARFGTSASLDKVFKESQQFMDPIVMHLKMATILSEAGKTSDALDIYKRAQKKFGGDNLDVWLLAMRHLFTEQGNNKPLAREMGERALQRLPANKHKDFTRQFALLEFELGDPERGRTLFEALLSVSPKRIDIWNVYIDQEIKLGDVKRYSALFERVLKQKISMKQAKFFFKKWISVAADQEYVANRAREYVSSRENAENDDSEDDE